MHIEMIEVKAFRTFIKIYSLFKTERLSVNIKVILIKALITSAVTYACQACVYEMDTCLLKLQRLQRKFLHVIGNYAMFT
jgi:hypothetical protein